MRTFLGSDCFSDSGWVCRRPRPGGTGFGLAFRLGSDPNSWLRSNGGSGQGNPMADASRKLFNDNVYPVIAAKCAAATPRGTRTAT